MTFISRLTLLRLSLPVDKVDDITTLQHVALLLHQLGHVDHRTIGAGWGGNSTNTALIHSPVVDVSEQPWTPRAWETLRGSGLQS